MRHLRILLAVMLTIVIMSPAAALAAEDEPYSGGEVTTTTLVPRITVVADGLNVSFQAGGVSEDCTWDFGDGTTGSGNPGEHVYAADGTYDVTATCGDHVIARSLTFAAALPFTGFNTGTFVLIAFVLLLLGGGAVWFTRRSRENS